MSPTVPLGSTMNGAAGRLQNPPHLCSDPNSCQSPQEATMQVGGAGEGRKGNGSFSGRHWHFQDMKGRERVHVRFTWGSCGAEATVPYVAWRGKRPSPTRKVPFHLPQPCHQLGIAQPAADWSNQHLSEVLHHRTRDLGNSHTRPGSPPPPVRLAAPAFQFG